MSERMTIRYKYHSGFSVACGEVLLIFDYWMGRQGAKLPEEFRITPEKLARYSEIYVFVSHGHEDHYDPVIYEWEQVAPVTYIIADSLPASARGRRIAPGGEIRLSRGVSVKAFDSTDEGVSFLVDVGGLRVFHAGDLNNWHWRDESTPKEIEDAENDFQAVMNTLRGERVDIAMFPVDPRLGNLYDAGANYFAMVMKPRLMIPMHFWEKADIIREYARRTRSDETEVIALVSPGDLALIDVDEQDVMSVRVQTRRQPAGAKVSLDAYEGEDPFLDCDMPVDLE